MTGKANLVVDLGNSQTRANVSYKVGNVEGNHLMYLSNKFAILENGYEEKAELVEASYPDSTAFHCSAIIPADPFENEPQRVIDADMINGEDIISAEYSQKYSKLVIKNKYSTPNTAYSLTLALIKGYQEIANACGITDLSLLDIEWTVVVLIPPQQYTGAKTLLPIIVKSIFDGGINVYYPSATLTPKLAKRIEVSKSTGVAVEKENIDLRREGFMGFAGVIFDSQGAVRNGYDKYVKSTSLVIDIGHGTTDLLVMRDGKPINESYVTIKGGGSNVVAEINKIYGASGSLSESSAIHFALTGQYKRGNQMLNMTGELEKIRLEVAKRITNDIKGRFDNIGVAPDDINYILIIGGSAVRMPEGIKSLGDYVAEEIKSLVRFADEIVLPTTELVEMNVDGIVRPVTVPVSPRDFNIKGAISYTNHKFSLN